MPRLRLTRLLLTTLLAGPVLAAGVVSLPATADAQDRRVRIVNETGYTMVRFYGSRCSTNDWEEDILGTDTLSHGNSVRINFDDGTGSCCFDFRAEFNDGDVLTRNNVNVCEIGTFTYN